MAMDKNDKLRLFKKVPKIDDAHLVEPLEQLAFLDVQIFERKKTLTRDYYDIERFKIFADTDDQTANQIAEGNVPEIATHIKALKLELTALAKLRKELIEEIGTVEVEKFYKGRKGTDYPLPAEWVKKNS